MTQNLFKITDLELEDFGPFVGRHKVSLPESGMVLFKGKVSESGDGSGAGKSMALNAIPYIFGGCPFPATDLQSWYTDSPPSVALSMTKGDVTYKLQRKKGLSIDAEGMDLFKGKAAESKLNEIMGLDSKAREVVTYRGQRQPGKFLSLSDPEKKSFLSKLLDIEKYEVYADEVAKIIADLEKELIKLEAKVQVCQNALKNIPELPHDSGIVQVEADSYAQQAEDLKQQIEKAQADLSQRQTQYRQLVQENALALDRFLSEIRAKATEVAKRVLPPEVAEKNTQIEQLKKLVKEAESIYNKKVLEVATLRGSINTKIAKIQGQINQRPRLEKELAKYREEAKAIVASTCPTCKQGWSNQDSKNRLEQLKTLAAGIKGELNNIAALELELVGLKEEIEAVEKPLPDTRIPAWNKQVEDLSLEIRGVQQVFESGKREDLAAITKEEGEARAAFKAPTNLGMVEDGIRKQEEAIKELKKGLESVVFMYNEKMGRVAQYKTIRDNKEKATNALELAQREYSELEKRIVFNKDLCTCVGRQGFLGVIFEDVLSEIGSTTNDILGRVANVRHLSLVFETEKEAKTSGNVSSRITPVIYNRGRKVTYEAGISGGMQAAVELAVDLAWGEVISRRRNSYPGWLIQDESLHGLGGVAKESCLEMLSDFAKDRLVLVVDHSAEFQGLFNQVIEIEQEEGKSRFV